MNKKVLEKVVEDEESGRKVKDVLKNDYNFSNRVILNIKKAYGILINGIHQNVNYKLKRNDFLQLYIKEDCSSQITPIKMPLDIIYEDNDILLINKPPKIIVHPTTHHHYNTLSNGIKYYFNSKNEECTIRPVNRLDRDTSGLLVIAKNQISHSFLSRQIKSGQFKKEYIAVVHDYMQNKCGVIDKPISRKPGSIIERMVNKNGKKSITEYTVKSQNNKASVLNIKLLTGRTHQVRVHLSYIGNPILGDSLYGKEDEYIDRQALHCSKIKFIHPINKECVNFYCETPKDMKKLIKFYNL